MGVGGLGVESKKRGSERRECIFRGVLAFIVRRGVSVRWSIRELVVGNETFFVSGYSG